MDMMCYKEKNVKKVITILLIVIMTVAFSTICVATEMEADLGQAIKETSLEPSLLTRVQEWLDTNKEVLIGIGTTITFIVSSILSFSKLSSKIKKMDSDTGTNFETMNASFKGANKATEEVLNKCKEVEESCQNLIAREEERDQTLSAMATMLSSLIEIQSLVYNNSKNLPCGIKDIISLKYSKCVKAVENNTALKNIFTALKPEITNQNLKLIAANSTEDAEE